MPKTPLSNAPVTLPGLPAVTVCGALSRLVHVIVVPAATVTFICAKPMMSASAVGGGARGAAVATCSGSGVAVGEGAAVAVGTRVGVGCGLNVGGDSGMALTVGEGAAVAVGNGVGGGVVGSGSGVAVGEGAAVGVGMRVGVGVTGSVVGVAGAGVDRVAVGSGDGPIVAAGDKAGAATGSCEDEPGSEPHALDAINRPMAANTRTGSGRRFRETRVPGRKPRIYFTFSTSSSIRRRYPVGDAWPGTPKANPGRCYPGRLCRYASRPPLRASVTC